MSNFFEATREAIRTGFCNYINFVNKGRSWVNEITPVDIPEFGGFVRRLVCDNPEPLPGPPTLEGGQCPGVPYRYRWLVDAGGGNIVESGLSPRTAIGPLVLTENVSGTTVSAAINGGQFYFANNIQPGDFTYEIFGVERIDGLPDDCGAQPVPPPPPFPPAGDTFDIDVTWITNEGDTFNESGDVTLFAPVLIAPVTIVAPIRVDLPDITFNGTLQISPEFDIRISPPDVIEPSPGVPDSPPPPEDPTTSPSTPRDSSDRELIGAIVTVTGADDSTATRVFGSGSPDLFVPRLGTIAYRVRVGGALCWQGNLDVKSTTQYFPAPENSVAVDAVFTPIPGVSGVVTLVYRDSEP